MAKYYVGAALGEKYVRILEKPFDKTLATSFNVQNAKLIVDALNAYEKNKKFQTLKKPLKK